MDVKEPDLLAFTENWIVVDKPAGWLTIPASEPSRGAETPSLLAWLRQRYDFVWTVHRIDRETSGLVLFARSRKAHREASLWFQKHRIRKIYHFLAQGIPESPILKIKTPIRESPSLTQIEVGSRFREGFKGCAFPRTGRRHQIRIHLASLGFPIWGDVMYGGSSLIRFGERGQLGVDRVALHAALLELPTAEKFEAPLPEDFKKWEKALLERGHRV